jgi:hypothetical protein
MNKLTATWSWAQALSFRAQGAASWRPAKRDTCLPTFLSARSMYKLRYRMSDHLKHPPLHPLSWWFLMQVAGSTEISNTYCKSERKYEK